MQERVEKYIYYINDNRYRVKFLKVNKKENIKISFDEYVDGTLEDAIVVRDTALKKAGIHLYEEQKEKKDDFAELELKDSLPNEPKSRKTIIHKSKNKKLVDKYIYEVEKGTKYRIFIRKGGSGQKLGQYYSEIFYGTLAQAKKLRDKKLAELKLDKYTSSNSNIKFIEFVKLYYKEYAEKELSPATVSSDKGMLKRYVLPIFANIPLNKIDALTIQKLINKLKNRDKENSDKNNETVKLSPTTVNGVYRLIRKILNKAVSWDYLAVNPALKVKTPGVSKIEKKSYNKDELFHILELLKIEDEFTEAMFTLAICTGLRRSELVGLHLEDINFDNYIINVKRCVVWDDDKAKAIEKETKTKGSVRSVPIPQFCTEAIKEYLKLRNRKVNKFKMENPKYIEPLNLFISDKKGKILSPNFPTQKWLKFRKNHPEIKNVSLHGLRHSYCSLQMNDNHDLSPADVQKLMGHSQLSTTFIYTHSNENKNQSAVAIFDDFYDNEREKNVNMNQLLSIYTKFNFITKNDMDSLIKFCLGENVNEEKYNVLLSDLERRYPFLKSIDISNVTIINVWDFLENIIKKYGNEFVLKQI